MPVSRTPIGDQLAVLYPSRSDGRRAGFKAAALAQRLGSRSFQVAGCVGGRSVTVSDVHVDDRGMLVCTITHPDIPAEANPFGFHNPPVRVGAGTFSTVPGPTGDRQIEDTKEDPAEAARQMIRDAVASVLSG